MAIDKRILKTKSNIKNAFMLLSVEKESDKISVSDIAAKAKVNRSTFYLHYADVAAVARDIEREIANRISADLDAFDTSDVYGSTYRMFTNNLTTALDNAALFKQYLLFSKESERIAKRLKEIILEKTSDALFKIHPELSFDKVIYPLTFAASGIVDTYIRWANHENESNRSLENLICEMSVITEYILQCITG